MRARISTMALAGVVALGAAGSAAADSIYRWNWQPGDSGVNNNAGVFNEVNAEFDANTQQLSWEASFGAVPNSNSLVTDGFTLAISPGPNPKGHAGELALFYFEASTGTPTLTAYAYNGINSASSYYDGSPQSGTQTPDRIASSLLDNSWINSLTYTVNNGVTTLGFDIDATVINSHVPLYPGPNGPSEWTGGAFGEHIGVWFHSFAGVTAGYSNGYLNGFGGSRQGWLDGSNFQTSVVPLPPAALLGVAGVVGLVVRRRRAAA